MKQQKNMKTDFKNSITLNQFLIYFLHYSKYYRLVLDNGITTKKSCVSKRAFLAPYFFSVNFQ